MNAEQWDVLRRIAERGLRLANHRLELFEGSAEDKARQSAHYQHLDLWQHMLDELERVKP